MAYYRVYLLNAADHIFSWHGIERDNDDAAIHAAADLAPAGLLINSAAVEIWAGARRIAYLTAKELQRQRAPADR